MRDIQMLGTHMQINQNVSYGIARVLSAFLSLFATIFFGAVTVILFYSKSRSLVAIAIMLALFFASAILLYRSIFTRWKPIVLSPKANLWLSSEMASWVLVVFGIAVIILAISLREGANRYILLGSGIVFLSNGIKRLSGGRNNA